MKKILVTGTSGFLGWSLANTSVGKYEVVGIYNSRKVESALFPNIHVDLTKEAEVVASIAAVQPDVVVHCAALSQPNQCAQDQQGSFNINVTATRTLAKLCTSQGIKLVFTSSDLVFDGIQGNYSEDDTVNPINVYGEHKAAAEQLLKELCPEAAICRMPIMFGNPNNGASSFLQGFVVKLMKGETLQLFYDEFRSMLHSHDAVNGLLWAAERVSGIIHLGGRARMSRYDFGLMLAEVMGVSPELIQKTSQKDVIMPARRAADVSLNSNFAFASGFKPLPVEDRLRTTVVSS